jgi:N-acetylmuramoyl-L-alanine amidase
MIKIGNKKILILMFAIVINLLYFFNDTNLTINTKKIESKFNLKNTSLEINNLYNEDNIDVFINGENKKENIIINKTNLQNNFLGTYYIKYEVKLNDYRSEYVFKKVKVVDETKPNIYLTGPNTYVLTLGNKYKEPGYNAIDNYDGDIKNKVKITGKVNHKKEGTYTLTYEVSDSSENKNIITREVVVTKEEAIVEKEKEVEEDDFDKTLYQNTITNIKISNNGLDIEGYVKNGNGSFELIIDGTEAKTTKLDKVDKKNYKGIINLTNLKNGEYDLHIKSKKKNKLLIKLDDEIRPVRFKLNDKLITLSYKKDNIKIKVEDFTYKYDILIDPGHGGEDTGAINNGVTEKNINLIQSNYEKKRYEEHGLKVKMIREDDTYGIMMGKDDFQRITKRAHAVGYYAAVSKISYSNHHNSSNDSSLMGWEVLLPAKLTVDDLKEEHEIIKEWNKIYHLKENHIRMYARDYNTDIIYNKINGQTYSFVDYYAVNRIPLALYGSKVPIYEGAFMSNYEDFNWYFYEENYKKLSEIKIKVYVESLGIKYKEAKEV